VPFFTPRGGISASSFRKRQPVHCRGATPANVAPAFRRGSIVECLRRQSKGDRMYIGGGFIALILIILLLIWLF
jgi:hypothetical protein